MTRGILTSVVALLLAGIVLAAPGPEDKPAAKTIDVVICLDTSNSMDGLIGSAKAKLWDIVNDLAKIKPTPNLRVGLYSYGNVTYDGKAGWVRKEADLTSDLDQISKQLFGLTTNGGDEYVGRVCRDALDQQKWSTDKDALRLIFVCGNEPASQDPVVKLEALAELAKGKDVIINPIFCGNASSQQAHDWKQLAALANGRFASIDQDRGTVAIAAPQDKKLADLSTELNRTYLFFGKEAEEKRMNQAAQDTNAAKLGQAAAATRAVSKASGLYRNELHDLVDRYKADPKFDVAKVPDDQLSAEVRKLKPEERVALVKQMAARREEIQKQINSLNAEREIFLQQERKKTASAADKAFDEAIQAVIREQAAAKGIRLGK